MLAFVGVLVGAQGSASARPRCHLSGSHTIVHSRVARVFVKNHRYYGCLYARGHRHRLPVRRRHDRVNHFTLAGHFVAYVDHICGPGDAGRLCGVTVHVIDVSNGSRTHTDHKQPPYAEGDTYGYADRVILVPDGAVAWSYHQADVEGEYTDPDPQIRKSDSAGERIVLDSTRGSATEYSVPKTHSLYLGSDRDIHWLRADCDYATYACSDTPMSAPLH